MNDELQNQLSGLVSDARSAGKDAASFVIQQAPDVATQYVRWELSSNLIQGGALISASIVLAIISRKLGRVVLAQFPEPECAPHAFGCVILATVSSIMMWKAMPMAVRAVQCYVAPKIVLMEGIKELVKP